LTIDLVSLAGVGCDGDNSGEITVVANGGTQPYANYTLTGASTSNNNNGVFANLPAGNYVVGVVDANNCTKTINETVSSPAPFSVPVLTATNPNCFGSADGSIDLSVSGGTLPYTFDWSNGENSEDIGFLTSGTYSVTITDENDCEISANQTLTDPAQVIADWVINTPGANGPHSIVSKPAPFTIEFIDVSQNSDITLNQWWVDGNNLSSNFYEGFSANSYQYTFTEMGNYEVVLEVTDGNCLDTISLVVSVQGIVEFNAFSPNGDNINDDFSFENYGISDLNAIFYNRWGDKIYEMNNPTDTWNGVSMNGLEVPEGVYFYVLNATGEDGTPYNEKGSVTIYR
jgi:gliding motility-associated-like protein